MVFKKKKVFAKIDVFSAKIGNSNDFSAQKQVISKEKKKRSSPKLSLIFRPKSGIPTLFHPESRHLLHHFGTQFPLGGAVFNFSPNFGLKSSKNVRFCILHKPMGRFCILYKPPLATLLPTGSIRKLGSLRRFLFLRKRYDAYFAWGQAVYNRRVAH